MTLVHEFMANPYPEKWVALFGLVMIACIPVGCVIALARMAVSK